MGILLSKICAASEASRFLGCCRSVFDLSSLLGLESGSRVQEFVLPAGTVFTLEKLL